MMIFNVLLKSYSLVFKKKKKETKQKNLFLIMSLSKKNKKKIISSKYFNEFKESFESVEETKVSFEKENLSGWHPL